MKILITGGNGNIAKIIKKKMCEKYEIISLNKYELNLLDLSKIKHYLENNNFDILINTAITGGRRTKECKNESFYENLLMFENLMKFNEKFKMIINLDSAAIYDRNTDILNRCENEIYTVPTDSYGLSKYVIYQRTLFYTNIYNFRIFNLFHVNEENDRFIKQCFISKKNKNKITIFENKYFDFFYENDFIKILSYYIDSINNQSILQKTINLSYKEKYKLSDIAKIICNINNEEINENNMITILSESFSKNNYSGRNDLIESYNLDFLGLENSLKEYEKLFSKLY
jgi:nucleoside-diphosphate-sugar epimerase